MNKISLKFKVILTILPLVAGFLVIFPNTLMIIPLNQNEQENNQLETAQDAIFNGLYLNYTFSMSGSGSGFSNFSYSHISGNDYSIYWDMFLGDSTWDENLDTRVISNSAGVYSYGDGNHAPLWIYTNSTLGDMILIAVDGVGDHAFNVTKEYTYNLLGFGSINVWQLEDLTFPGAVALYEQSTGFLVKGFFATNPTFNYTLDIITTNMVFNYTKSDHSIFDGLYVKYNWTSDSFTFPMNFTFTEDPLGTYNVTWNVFLSSFSWNEYIANRTILNPLPSGSGFDEYSHTPVWIHTDVVINDIIPITVDGVGDHSFQVKKAKKYNLEGFGWIDIWILQDLANSSSEIWYEKSTGLLIQGTFIYGAENYTITFLDTNAIFTYVNAPSSAQIPGYNLAMLLGLLVVLPLVLIRIKKRKK